MDRRELLISRPLIALALALTLRVSAAQVQDAAAVQGVAFSNALQAITP